jgi:beta-glucanase (GH16 family)
MSQALSGLVASCALACATAPAVHATPLGPPTWSDEFDGDTLDSTKWADRLEGTKRHDGFLTHDAVSVDDGHLTITTYTEDAKHYSGMISTHLRGSDGFEQKYGYFEARMRFHSSPGQWSAFWLQSRTIDDPHGDPEQAGVEMDVVEHRARCGELGGCDAGADISDRAQQGLIWDGYATGHPFMIRLSDELTGLDGGGWHTWAMSWTPTEVTFLYDDTPMWSVPGPISRRSQYLILSSEVGKSFAGEIPTDGYGSREKSDTNVEVDYVRAWDTTLGATAPANVSAPVASGTASPGHKLTCAPGTWTGEPAPSLRYQWRRDGATIEGASTPGYIVRGEDRGHALACRVSGVNRADLVRALSNAFMIPAPAQKVAATVRVTIVCTVCRASVVSATAFGEIRVPRVGRTKARTYKLVTTATTSADGKTVTVAVRVVRRVRDAITRALRAGRHIEVTFGVRVRDSVGKTGTITRRVALKL